MGFYIYELRKRKGLTQQEVADYFNVSRTTYNAWEKNIKKLPVSKALEVIKYLSDGKCTLDDIIF
ncbi:hypothetical protein B7939_01075 [Eggerthia catenaformis]|nr:hypothetical protein B7939_01075 [Eggerthia catenaformis]